MKSKLTALGLLLAGFAGGALQVWTQQTAFDPATHLVLEGQASLTALRVFACAVPLLAALASLWLRAKKSPSSKSLCAGAGWGCRLLGPAAGLLLISGGLMKLVADFPVPPPRMDWLSLGMCGVDLLLALGGGCMIWQALGAAFRPGWTGRHSLSCLIPGFSVCFWLILFYHNHSRDPVVSHYCWILLALMAAILALYHQAAYSFGRAHPVQAQICTLTAGVYAFTALPSAGEAGDRPLLLGLGLWMLLNSLLIAGGKEGGPWKRRTSSSRRPGAEEAPEGSPPPPEHRQAAARPGENP